MVIERWSNMKKRVVSITLALAMLFVLSLTTACNPAGDDAEESVEAAVDVITIKGRKYKTSLTELNLREKELQDEDIISLKHMTNLISLDLSGNQISDLTPLSGLKDLEWLKLSNNQISDLNPLSGLKDLEFLDLSFNQISDIKPLAELTELGWLVLYGNGLTVEQINDLKAKLPNCNLY